MIDVVEVVEDRFQRVGAFLSRRVDDLDGDRHPHHQLGLFHSAFWSAVASDWTKARLVSVAPEIKFTRALCARIASCVR